MTQPTSLPVIPAQPNQQFYDFTALELFQKFDRASYKAAFGVDAPNWDATKPLKRWFDTSATPGPYKTVQGHVGTVSIIPLDVLNPAQVNLPGLIPYAPYVVAPTQATRGGATLNANYLCLPSDAQALMVEIGGTKVIQEDSTFFPVTYPANEPRRLCDIVCGGAALPAGLLLLQKNGANGIGAPGKWIGVGTANPNWVSDPLPPDGIHSGVATAEVPVPVRDLLPNEKISANLAGAQIERTDLGGPGPSPAGGSFTDVDRATLADIQRKMNQLLGIG